jgi:hypothetical protein
MEESAWIVETLAGGFFILAGIPLLRLAARRGASPERMLGLTFVLMGGGSRTTAVPASAFASAEGLTIAMVWLAFFPPALYRGWIDGAAAAERSSAR